MSASHRLLTGSRALIVSRPTDPFGLASACYDNKTWHTDKVDCQ